jgi:chromosome segregation ATPase
MRFWVILFRIVILLLFLASLGFDVLLYKAFEQQKKQIEDLSERLQAEQQVSSNQFKSQQEQIDHLGKDLQDAQQQMIEEKNTLVDAKDALLREIDKRQTSFIDVKAEADAIKQDMKTWQKDYVTVLAQLEKKMEIIDSLKADIEKMQAGIEKLNPAPSETKTDTPNSGAVNK